MSILATSDDEFIGVFYPSIINDEELELVSKKWNLSNTLNPFSNPVLVTFRVTEK